MSEIPFVHRLGDALERAVAKELASGRQNARGLRRLRLRSGRGRLLLVLAALGLAGGALAATLRGPNPVGAAQVSCSAGTSDTAPGPEGLSLNGLSPVAACLHEFRREGVVSMTRPGVRFVVCQQAVWLVHVMVADGRANQCRRLGLRPLPSGYSRATTRVAVLERALGRLQQGHDCIPPAVLLSEIRGLLGRLAFTGWRPELAPPSPSTSTGHCAQFPGSDTQPSDPYLALNPTRRVVVVGTGPPLSIEGLRDVGLPRLSSQSGSRCLSLNDAMTLARQALAHPGWRVSFALSRELLGQQFNAARQRRYDANCTVVVDVLITTATRTMGVWLNNRSAPALPRGEAAPTPNAYRG